MGDSDSFLGGAGNLWVSMGSDVFIVTHSPH